MDFIKKLSKFFKRYVKAQPVKKKRFNKKRQKRRASQILIF